MGAPAAARFCPESALGYVPREAESAALCDGPGGYERRTTMDKRNAEMEVKRKERARGKERRRRVQS
jgi:hypothetical protein